MSRDREIKQGSKQRQIYYRQSAATGILLSLSRERRNVVNCFLLFYFILFLLISDSSELDVKF
jgi:hypothetical protein